MTESTIETSSRAKRRRRSSPLAGQSAPATIREVAVRAGVSTATVSRVLAGLGKPRPATSAAVLSAVEELGYRPSGIARSLRMRRTRTLGLIVTDIQNPFFPELVQTADDVARAMGYSILLGSAAYDEQRAMHYLDLMADRRVDGLIIASSQVSAASSRSLLGSPIPVVVVNAEPTDLPVTVITSDNEAGSRMAVEYLAALGHRQIAYVRGPQSFTAATPRLAGFRAGCQAAGLDPDAMPILRGEGQVESGETAAQEILASGARVTAVACYNDLTAIGVLRAFRAAGCRVPEEISVIGCDDIAAASWVVPALSTIAQQKAEMGRLAVERLAALIERPDAPREVVRLPMVLRERESTGPARPADPSHGPNPASSNQPGVPA